MVFPCRIFLSLYKLLDTYLWCHKNIFSLWHRQL
nr:MAG TPA: hypothetical protein [Caudoviricetes sp.]